jgi:hypothetical protein
MTTDDTRPRTATGKLVADEFFSLLVDNFAGTKHWNEQEQLRRVDALVADVEAEAIDADRARHAALVAAAREVVEWGNDSNEGVVRIAAIRAALDGEPRAEPSCCELACYEDPGCSCDGCKAEDEMTRLRLIEKAAREAMRAGWFTTNDAGDRAADALRAALDGEPR